MLSALQHYSYCPRQCALIHVEQVWDENLYTLRGRRVHERAHEAGTERRGRLWTERDLPLWSDRLGLVGRADVVELTVSESEEVMAAYPVEYKHGRRHQAIHDDLQLCAQAMCLEEMFGLEIPRGAIYHASSRRRREVALTSDLRGEVEHVTQAVRHMIESREVPAPVADARCRRCSLRDSCLPFARQRLEGRST